MFKNDNEIEFSDLANFWVRLEKIKKEKVEIVNKEIDKLDDIISKYKLNDIEKERIDKVHITSFSYKASFFGKVAILGMLNGFDKISNSECISWYKSLNSEAKEILDNEIYQKIWGVMDEVNRMMEDIKELQKDMLTSNKLLNCILDEISEIGFVLYVNGLVDKKNFLEKEFLLLKEHYERVVIKLNTND